MDPVGADDEVGLVLAELAVVAGGDAAVAGGGEDLDAEVTLDAGLGGEGVEEEALQGAAPDHAEARGGARRGGEDPPAGVDDRGGVDGAPESGDRGAEADRLEHGEAVLGERDPGPDGLRTRDFLEQGDAGAGAGEQERRGGAAGGPADDEDVELGEVHGEEGGSRGARGK